MPEEVQTLEGVSVVLRGNFNPSIFSPAWFLHQELIGSGEHADAEVNVIAREVCQFSMGWLSVFADSESLILSTTFPEEFERVRDAAIGVLKILRHTPVATLGINRDSHLAMPPIAEWHAVGDALLPKDGWSELLSLAGMRDVTLWGQRTDGRSGHIQVQVQPSTRIPQAIYIGHNDHFTLGKFEAVSSRGAISWDVTDDTSAAPEKIEEVIEVLNGAWRESMTHADRVVQFVLQLPKKSEGVRENDMARK